MTQWFRRYCSSKMAVLTWCDSEQKYIFLDLDHLMGHIGFCVDYESCRDFFNLFRLVEYSFFVKDNSRYKFLNVAVLFSQQKNSVMFRWDFGYNNYLWWTIILYQSCLLSSFGSFEKVSYFFDGCFSIYKIVNHHCCS